MILWAARTSRHVICNKKRVASYDFHVPAVLSIVLDYVIIRPYKGVSNMPQIIPIRDLKDTAKISQMCSNEPIYITKNGYGDMVIMSIQAYEERLGMADIYAKLAEAEEDIQAGRISNAASSLSRLRAKYNV